MGKQILVCLLIAAATSIMGQNAIQPAGEGTADNPFLVATLENLYWISQETAAGNSFSGNYFQQTAHIDASATTEWFENQGWVPIGTMGNPFSGIYDGGDYTIDGLSIQRPETNHVGLFGMINGATVKNLGLTNLTIHGKNNVGGLAGLYLNSSFVSRVYTTGMVTGTNNVGGIAGMGGIHDDNNELEYCFSRATVSGFTNTGGLLGSSEGDISKSYATGDVTGNLHVGGLAGYLSIGSIKDCYSTGNVTGHSNVGGLIGRHEYFGVLENSYSVGRVTGEIYTGGMMGYHWVWWGHVNHSFWNTESAAQISSAEGSARNTLEMIHFATFHEWDFDETWQIIDGVTYPFLLWQSEPEDSNYPVQHTPVSNVTSAVDGTRVLVSWDPPSVGLPSQYRLMRDGSFFAAVAGNTHHYSDNTVSHSTIYQYKIIAVYNGAEATPSNTTTIFFFPWFAGGDGSLQDPYLVANHHHLNAIRYYPSSHFRQTANINLTGSQWIQGEGWNPIGDGITRFSGSYNGNGFSINGLFINRPQQNMQGLFAITRNATLTNITLTNVNITGKDKTGAIAGSLRSSILSNSQVSGTVEGYNEVGGLVGESVSSMVLNCTNSATVPGSGKVGGIVGYNRFPLPGESDKVDRFYGATVTNCHNSGNISGFGAVGGIAGVNEGFALIAQSSNIGNIEAYNFAGGITGGNEYAVIRDCYNRGNVSGTNAIAGIVAFNDDLPSWGGGYVPNTSNTYNTGLVTANTNDGALVATGASADLVEFSYWNSVTTGSDYSLGGEPRSTGEMTFPHASNTYEGWNFATIWAEDNQYNNGYPFLQDKYSLVIKTQGMGTIQVDNQSYFQPIAAVQGRVYSLKAIPDNNWTFNGWSGDLYSGSSTVNLTMNNHKNIIASFTAIPPTTANLKVLAYPPGSGTVSGGGTYQTGEAVTVSAIADSIYSFKGWYILNEKISDDLEYTFSMPGEDMVLVGKFSTGLNVGENIGGFNVSVYPNPAKDGFHLASDISMESVEMIDITGRVIIRSEVNDDAFFVRNPGMKPGLYFLRITTGFGLVTRKIQIID